nr:RICIN domain-containing protein [Armatimonas sp.]
MNKFCVAMILTGCVLTCAVPGMGADPEEGEYYRIKNVRSKKVLSVADDGKEKGAPIVQVVPGPSELQQWQFVKVGGYYKIVNRKTGMALNVESESMQEGAPIIQWDARVNKKNQQWSLVKKGDFFAIKVRHSGLVLDVAAGSKERRVSLIQYPLQRNDNGNQIFELVPVKAKP